MSRRRKILIVFSVVFGVAILVPVIRHYQLRAATEAYIAQLKAQGEPMDLAQVLPPTVSPEQNGADTFRRAAALIDADTHLDYTNYVYGMVMIAPGKAMVRWQQPDVRDSDVTNSWEAVDAAVSQNAQSFALLQQMLAKPNFDFHINYAEGVANLNFTNFYLPESKRAAQRLETAALCDLHRSETASAVENLRAMLALVKALRDERLVISELVRIAIANIALTVNWEVIQSTNVTDGQLAELQHDWNGLNFVQNDENALAMERAAGEITLTKWRSSNSELQNYFDRLEQFADPEKKDTAFDKFKIKAKVYEWRYWWSYPDELRLLKGYQAVLETTHFAETNYSLLALRSEQENKLQKVFITTNNDETVWFGDPKEMDMHLMLSDSLRGLSAVFGKVMRVETAKQVVTTAIGLKRYQLKHGNYPNDLNLLVPEFVAKVPLDPVDGQPLRYRLNADGTFLLYSVGENGLDDGGNPAFPKYVQSSNYYWQNPEALDWVWPQPATEQEIQNYYAHPPK